MWVTSGDSHRLDRALNNITLESQAIARGLDEQQLHNLPRNSRDIQSFLLLNPNVVGGARRHPVPLAATTYSSCHTCRTARPRQTPSSARSATRRLGLDAISEITVLSKLGPRQSTGGLAGVVVTTKSGASSYRGTSFYDFNNSALNALTYNQTLAGVQQGNANADTHEHRWGGGQVD